MEVMNFVIIEARWFCPDCQNANKHSLEGNNDREEYYDSFDEIVKHIIETGHDSVIMQLRGITPNEY